MKKLQIVLLALVAVFAFSAVVAGSASAEVTLLAEWTIGGVKVAGPLTVETTGLISLATLVIGINGIEIDCEGTWDGTVNTDGTGSITALLNAAKEEIGKTPLTGLSLSCTVAVVLGKECTAVGTLAELWPVNLPWRTNLELMESGKFLNHLFAGGTAATEPGYEIVCLAPDANENLCKGLSSAEAINLATDVEGIFSTAVGSEKVTCTTGEGDPTGTGLTSSSEGSLQVTSE
jgi:hypothetical protein